MKNTPAETANQKSASASSLEAHIKWLRSKNQALSRELEQQKFKTSMLEQKLFIHYKSGLPNHQCLDRDIQALLCQAVKERQDHSKLPTENSPIGFSAMPKCRKIAVLIVRLDNKYDMVVKTLKTAISEWVLYQIGVRIGECVQPGERLYHTKDDEYVVILSNFASPSHLKGRLSTIYDAVIKPHIFSGHHLHLGCNIGVSLFPQHGQNKSAMLHSADIAMSQAVLHRKPWLFFEDTMRNSAVEKMELQSHIIKALELQSSWEANEQFSIFYQPQVQIGPVVNGVSRIHHVDAEVLIRWKHPQKGMIAPDKFIPLAEETGLILPIGNWIMFKAIEQLENWEGSPMEHVTLSINISPRQFADQQLMDNLVAMLHRKPSLKNRLKLEITETSLMDDPEKSIQRLRYLNKMGLRFALDDFGKGYSSLNYLTELPLHTLKLDRAFISNVHENPADQAIVRAVVFLAKRLKLKLICEGIETSSQLQMLQKQGCRCFQGYYFSKALSLGDFTRFIQQTTERPMVGTPQ